MNRQPIYTNQTPAGCERYGNTEGIEASNISSVYAMPGTEPAMPSDVPYGRNVLDHCTYHYPEGHECRAPKVRGDAFCIGHKKQRINAEKKAEALKEQVQE
jgi:hypothetical protein